MAERPQRVLLLRRLLARLPPGRLPAGAAGLRRPDPPVRHLSPAPDDDALAEAYLRLVLRLARQDPALVETTLPVPQVPAVGWDALATEAAALARDAGDDERGRWVAGQAAAVGLACRVRAGADVAWEEQVEGCLQVRPSLGDVDRYAAAHDALEQLLPGNGPLLARYEAHRQATAVPPERLGEVFQGAVDLLRSRTPRRPDGERVEVVRVSGAPWSALCRGRSPLVSEVLLSTRRPVPPTSLLALAAHETYPGHHHERVLLAGLPERAVAVVATPEAVVTEGLGETALRVSGVRLHDTGLSGDLELAQAVADAAAPLARTKTDAAVLLHRTGEEAAGEHLRRWGLHSPARALGQLHFLLSPRWAVHAVAYGAGADLVGAWLDAGRSGQDLLGRDVHPAELAPPPRGPAT